MYYLYGKAACNCRWEYITEDTDYEWLIQYGQELDGSEYLSFIVLDEILEHSPPNRDNW